MDELNLTTTAKKATYREIKETLRHFVMIKEDNIMQYVNIPDTLPKNVYHATFYSRFTMQEGLTKEISGIR